MSTTNKPTGPVIRRLDMRLDRCAWCNRTNVPASSWEQQDMVGGWKQMCRRCAKRKLANPYNGLLPMRQIEEA